MEAYLGGTARLIDYRSGKVFERHHLEAAAYLRASELARIGVKNGNNVVLAQGDGAAFLADLLAIWHLGAVAVIVSSQITQLERENVRSATKPFVWIGPKAPNGLHEFAPASFDVPADNRLLPQTRLDDAAVIMMTSGTTSTPKGVVLTHRSLQARLALNLSHIGTADLSVSLSVLPLHFGHGLIGNTLTPLSAGATVVLWPNPGPTGLSELGKVIDQHNVTFMSSVPSLWRIITRISEKPRAGSLKRVHVGSAPLSSSLWQDIIEWTGIQRVVNMYGITETANWIGGWSGEDGELEDNKVGPAWGGSFRVKMPDGTLALSGCGEIAVNSPSLMSGYFNMPEQTAAALKGHWFLTGDIGNVSQDGDLRLVGRSKFEINKGGIKIPAEEIDALLELHPDILEACAFAIPDLASGEDVAAAVVLKEDAKVNKFEIRQWCLHRIRKHAVPAKLYFLESLPRTDRGKLNRDSVRTACMMPEENNDQ